MNKPSLLDITISLPFLIFSKRFWKVVLFNYNYKKVKNPKTKCLEIISPQRAICSANLLGSPSVVIPVKDTSYEGYRIKSFSHKWMFYYWLSQDIYDAFHNMKNCSYGIDDTKNIIYISLKLYGSKKLVDEDVLYDNLGRSIGAYYKCTLTVVSKIFNIGNESDGTEIRKQLDKIKTDFILFQKTKPLRGILDYILTTSEISC